MGRSPCCEKIGLKKGPWTPEEDQKLLAYIEKHGHGSWRALPNRAGLQRCGKSCRLRWTNYLRPDIKRGKFSLQEEQTIIQLHALLGNRWSAIATHLPKRTDNEIKNYWNTHLKKRLAKMGIDPVTHKAKSNGLWSADGRSKNAANLSHTAQWESARLQAEARLALESKLRSSLWPKPSANSIHGGRYTVDLDSPTSTLSFSGLEIGEDKDLEWKTGLSMSTLTPFAEAEVCSWLSEASAGGFGAEDLCNKNQEDEYKSYWSSILNLVNSSSPSSSNSQEDVF